MNHDRGALIDHAEADASQHTYDAHADVSAGQNHHVPVDTSAGGWVAHKHLSLIDDLIDTLDLLVYAELAIIVYLDTSFLRFLLRCFVQLIYITPKRSSNLPEPPAQPFLGGIVGTNAICLLSHVYFPCPEANEVTRGYLHGGLMLDFVGQRPPVSRLLLVAMDVLVLLLQAVGLASTLRRKHLYRQSNQLSDTTANVHTAPTAPSIQDHNAEEQGLAHGSGTQVETRRRWSRFSLSDELLSGRQFIAELHVVDALARRRALREAPFSQLENPLGPELRAYLSRGRWQLRNPF